MSIGEGFPLVLAAARLGEEWAWERLFTEVAGPVLGYLRSRGAGSPEDVAGEVFYEMARSIHRFEGDESSFRSWVFVIAHRRLIDERRWRGRRREGPLDPAAEMAGGEDVEEAALGRIGSERVRRLLGLLTDDQREVLALRVIGGLTLEETAAVVSKPLSAVKALQRRGLARLRRMMEREGVSL